MNGLLPNIAEATQLEKKEATLGEEEEEDEAEVDESLAPTAFEVQPARPEGCDVNALQEGSNHLCANAPRIPRKRNAVLVFFFHFSLVLFALTFRALFALPTRVIADVTTNGIVFLR